MNDDKYFAELFCQRHNVINGRNSWMYLISTSIGNFVIVEYENNELLLVRKLFENDYGKAESYFERVCRKMISGKI